MSLLQYGLKEKGIEPMRSMEVFDPVSEDWKPFRWSSQVGPVKNELDIFLFRYDGVSSLKNFQKIRRLAGRLVGI